MHSNHRGRQPVGVGCLPGIMDRFSVVVSVFCRFYYGVGRGPLGGYGVVGDFDFLE